MQRQPGVRGPDRSEAAKATWSARWQRAASNIPVFAAMLVAITAVTTAWMVTRQAVEQESLCSACGVVESVVAVQQASETRPAAYRMRVRMDDGSVRTVEQRGALATGSRVVVAGSALRLLSGRG